MGGSENEGPRVVLLEIGNEEVQKKRFASAGAPKNHGMGDVALMKVQEVRGVVIRFENCQIFLTKVRVLTLATVESEEKGIIRVVGIEKI